MKPLFYTLLSAILTLSVYAQPSGKYDNDVYGPAGTGGDIGHAKVINDYLRSKGAKIPIYLIYLPTIDYYVTYDEKTR